MSVTTSLDEHGVLHIVVAAPPVNAFAISTLQELTAALRQVPEAARAVLIRSQGRGFCGGGDVKEVEALPGFDGLLGQTTNTLAVCTAIEDCPVPVIVAVHGYCIGVGVLICGVCDVLLAEAGTKFVLAEADNGATVGVVQALGLLPEKRMRSAMLLCEPVDAGELHAYGSVYEVTEPGALLRRAQAVAEAVAAKNPAVIRRLKASMNLTTGRDLVRKFRAELSYTYELNLLGEAARERQTFVDGSRGGYLSGS